MITTFPVFSALDISHKPEIEAITHRFKPYSDFNFTSLFAWDTDGSTQISQLHDNLIIRLPHYLTGEPTISLLGNTRIPETVGRLLDTTSKLELVPETVIKELPSTTHYLVSEDRDNFDYLLRLEPIIAMEGADFKKKRNKVNGVKAAVGSDVSVITSAGTEHVELIKETFIQWATQYAKAMDGEAAAEFTALSRLLENIDDFNVLITCVFVGKRLAGFSINEVLTDNMAICHFEKALEPPENIATYVSYVVAQELQEIGCNSVNWEQDLGIAGLRQAKLSYKPYEFLKKYSLTRS